MYNAVLVPRDKFQFQIGVIKSDTVPDKVTAQHQFQFQIGVIKRRC